MELKIGDFGLATKLEFEGELKRSKNFKINKNV